MQLTKYLLLIAVMFFVFNFLFSFFTMVTNAVKSRGYLKDISDTNEARVSKMYHEDTGWQLSFITLLLLLIIFKLYC